MRILIKYKCKDTELLNIESITIAKDRFRLSRKTIFYSDISKFIFDSKERQESEINNEIANLLERGLKRK